MICVCGCVSSLFHCFVLPICFALPVRSLSRVPLCVFVVCFRSIVLYGGAVFRVGGVWVPSLLCALAHGSFAALWFGSRCVVLCCVRSLPVCHWLYVLLLCTPGLDGRVFRCSLVERVWAILRAVVCLCLALRGGAVLAVAVPLSYCSMVPVHACFHLVWVFVHFGAHGNVVALACQVAPASVCLLTDTTLCSCVCAYCPGVWAQCAWLCVCLVTARVSLLSAGILEGRPATCRDVLQGMCSCLLAIYYLLRLKYLLEVVQMEDWVI